MSKYFPIMEQVRSSLSEKTLDTGDRKKMPKGNFAFPKEKKEPLNDKNHVRDAMARFNQVKGVSSAEKKSAKNKIKRKASVDGIKLDRFKKAK